MTLRSLLLFAFAVLAGFPVVAAQSPPIVQRNIQFEHVAAETGLSQEFVHTIAQDGAGYMWFGTQDGLNRWDGQQIRVYESDIDDPESLSNSFIQTLFVDEEGRLWIGTNGGGLNRYEPATDSFQRNPLGVSIPGLATARISAIEQDTRGVFWLGTVGEGLLAVDTARNEVRRYVHTPDNARSLPNDWVTEVVEDSKGYLWVGTDGGLARFDAVTDTFVNHFHDETSPVSLSDDHVRALYEDSQGNLWVGTLAGGVNLLDPGTGMFQQFRHDPGDSTSIASDTALSILEDEDGTLWVGTEKGLSEWYPQYGRFANYASDVTDPSSLRNDRVGDLFQDSGGVLWLATYGGVSSWNYVSDTFSYFSSDTGHLTGDIVTSVTESSNGVLWVGTYGAGLSRIDLTTGEIRHFHHDPLEPSSLSDDRVMSVHVDRYDTVWVGTRDGGLNRLDAATNTFERYIHDPDDPSTIGGDAIARIHSDRFGELWIGVFDGGLNRLLPDGTFERFVHDPDDETTISSNRVLSILRDRRGSVWVGTEGGGLNRLVEETGTFERIDVNPEVDDSNRDTIWELVESRDGTLWMGTQGTGLIAWTAEDREARVKRFQRYKKSDGLSSDTVYGIIEGPSGAMWLSSNRGLSRFDPTSGLVRHFDRRNGLRSNEFTQGARLRSRSGRLLFGGTGGLVGFYPGQLRTNSHVPPVAIVARSRDSLLAAGVSNEPIQAVKLGYLDSFISFEFVGLDYASPDKNRYRYQLSGFDETWVDAGGFRQAMYTNLPSGQYRFRVQAANNDGVWNETGGAVDVEVIPPPWNTWWAYLAYITVIAATIWWYVRAQKMKLARAALQRLQLEELVQQRTQELAARNDELQTLNDRLAEASVTDSLTGLHNRRYVDHFIEAEIATLERTLRDGFGEEKVMFFMMIDLDGFKAINDDFGHHAGDLALIEVKDRLLACCRKSDAVIRWGGDEFMVIGNDSRFPDVKVLAERIREAIAREPYDIGNGNQGLLSASIGLVPLPFCRDRFDLCSWEQIAGIADAGAYLAKANGRNAWFSLEGTALTEAADLPKLSDDMERLIADGRLVMDTSIESEVTLDRAGAVERRAVGVR